MNIIQMRNSNAFPARNGYKPRWLILHGTAGGTSAQAIAQFFQNAGVSAHYVIGVDGQIVQCNDEADGAWSEGVVSAGHDPWWSESGNPNPNNVCISIEHCKPSGDNSDALTPAQQAASFWLVADICKRNGIPARPADANGGITGHYSIDPVNRARCPGNFPWAELWKYLANGGNTMSGVPTGWSDDGTTLTASNGHKVVAGFRSWILTHSWDATNVPLEEEHNTDPVEDYYKQIPSGGARQLFLFEELGWNAARGVYVVGIGNELRGARIDRDRYKAQIIALQAQIAALQNQPGLANLQQINLLASQASATLAKIGTLSQVQ